ncbi:MAG: FGGY-family carbohydrate kinase [Chitinophagales bacterium]
MQKTHVIAVFDIGKTNKKLFLFDESYQILWEKSSQLQETTDEDGFPCEDIGSLQSWIEESFSVASSLKNFEIKAINFSSYGASLVHLDSQSRPLTPLYNYLKPFPSILQESFYNRYGGPKMFSLCTASPILGSLNSGLQLLRLKVERPQLFEQVRFSLHLPQWISSLFTGKYYSDMTSIGSHTAMWNFFEKAYHEWLKKEGVETKLATIMNSNEGFPLQKNKKKIIAGIGLHDSSAALIPYQLSMDEPFLLISTGTWSISLNPFNWSRLEAAELEKDCLCYLDYHGNQVKASRLFLGNEHEEQVKRLSAHFQVAPDYYKQVPLDPDLLPKDFINQCLFHEEWPVNRTTPGETVMENLNTFKRFDHAYHRLICDLIVVQKLSTDLVLVHSSVKKIFVDGGFSRNEIFMKLLAAIYPNIKIYAATVAQASALGAALAIHKHWNVKPIPENLILSKQYLWDTI